jgi:hypothetical protein
MKKLQSMKSETKKTIQKSSKAKFLACQLCCFAKRIPGGEGWISAIKQAVLRLNSLPNTTATAKLITGP